VKAIAEGTITWSDDDDFGYLVAESVPGIDDPELLQPRRLYERRGRIQEYRDFVERFKAERVEFLKGFPALEEEIIKAVG
jgi:phosphoenolpyruvate carboxykinase (ATP)